MYVFESVVVEACPVRGRFPTMLWNLAKGLTHSQRSRSPPKPYGTGLYFYKILIL